MLNCNSACRIRANTVQAHDCVGIDEPTRVTLASRTWSYLMGQAQRAQHHPFSQPLS